MAKKYKNKELRAVCIGNLRDTAKERTISAIFLALTTAGISFLLEVLKNDTVSDEKKLF